jgi:hypothetical protein
MTPQRKAAAWAAAVAVLAAAFAAYLDPSFVLGLATQLWNCF